ncbi:MAG: hypothetical protein Q4D62_11815, partial [Planctomycetia bacterium]|nr:hypothetical protein [Planctomycetia bacterium]
MLHWLFTLHTPQTLDKKPHLFRGVTDRRNVPQFPSSRGVAAQPTGCFGTGNNVSLLHLNLNNRKDLRPMTDYAHNQERPFWVGVDFDGTCVIAGD